MAGQSDCLGRHPYFEEGLPGDACEAWQAADRARVAFCGCLQRDDDFAPGVTLIAIAEGFGRLTERVTLVDDGDELSGFEKVF